MDQLVVIVLVGLFALGKWALENMGKSSGEEDASARRDADADADAQGDPSGDPFGRGRGRGGRGQSDPPMRQQPIPGQEDEEERIRRFMEALGLPAGSAPPPRRPPVQQQPVADPSFDESLSQPTRSAAPQGEPPPQSQPQWSSRPKRSVPRPKKRSFERNPWELKPRQTRPLLSQPLPPLEPMAKSEPGEAMEPIPEVASVDAVAPQMEVASIPEMHFARPQVASVDRPQNLDAPIGSIGSLDSGPLRTLSGQGGPGARNSLAAPVRNQLKDRAALRHALVLREILGPPKALQE